MDKLIKEWVAEWFGIEPDEDGEYNLCSYEWTSGCYHGYGDDRKWLSIAEVYYCLRDFAEVYCDDDIED